MTIEQEFAAFRARVGEFGQHIGDRITALEGAPVRDAAAVAWEEGRAACRRAGYDDEGIQRLEASMLNQDWHQAMMAIDPQKPTGSAKIFGNNLPEDLELLHQGRDDDFVGRVMAKIRAGQ